MTAVNANPSLAQCNTSTNNTGLCKGIDYGQWNIVTGSDVPGSYTEYYAFGNPQPTFDPTTHAITNLSVQVVGAAHDPNTATNYIFDSQNINLSAQNGFLTGVWWSNFESYNPTGIYTSCNYNWKNNKYNINTAGARAEPSTSGPTTTSSGRVHQRLHLREWCEPGHGRRLTLVRQCVRGTNQWRHEYVAGPDLGDHRRSELPVRRRYQRDEREPAATAPRQPTTSSSTIKPTVPKATASRLLPRATPSSAPSPNITDAYTQGRPRSPSAQLRAR